MCSLGHSPAEFTSTPDQTHLNQLINVFRVTKSTGRLHWKRKMERDASRNTLVSGELPFTQHQQHQAAGGGFQGKGQRTHPVTQRKPRESSVIPATRATDCSLCSLRSTRPHTSRLRDSFFSQAIRLRYTQN